MALHLSLLWAVGLVPAVSAAGSAAPPKPLPPLPTPQQLAWQRCETIMFAHFTVNTFTDREWGEGTEDPKIFNPVKLDARQWVRAAKAGGFKMLILTAKHHDGFCLWPSKYTEHSVKQSSWRDGKGDVVQEAAAACRAQGLKFGIYLSPWDRHEKTYGDSPKYNEYFRNQLTELLTNYGPIAEVWFDGACGEGPNGKRQEYDWQSYYAVIRKLQPDALIAICGPDIRWIGNENGTAGDPCWSPFNPAAGGIDSLQHGDPNGTVWQPGECDVSIRPGWFWHKREDALVRSVDDLVDLYFQSVGRNAVLLLNVPPNHQGLFCDTDVERLRGFRARLDEMFGTNLAAGKKATASNTRAGDERFGAARAVDDAAGTYWATDDDVTSGWIEVDLGAAAKFNIASMQEAIELGQRVAAYHLEYWDGSAWRTITSGTTIGHKKLDRFPAVTARRVRLVIDRARACPTIQSFGLYCCE
jgi:alpha-L-fucosidase